MSVKITPRVEMDFGGGWVDVSEDVVSGVVAEWGVHGSTLKDRVADVGTMTFTVDNSVSNTGGVRGYYSPGHESARSGFVLGAPARLVLNHALFGDKVKWVGTVESVKPVPGVENPSSEVHCVDWMDESARAKLSGLAVQEDVQSDEVFELLMAAVARQPPGGFRAGSGSEVYGFALDTAQDESSRILSELQKLALSELGFVYVSAGTLVFEGRSRRSGAGTVRFAMHEDEEILEMTPTSYARDAVANRAQVSVHPRRVDADTETVLFNLGSAVEIARNTSVTIKCPYRDPNQQAQRVGGMDMVTPVATTDYSFNTQKNGSGADITAQLTVDATFGGNAAVLVVTNGGPADGWIPANGLQLRGRGLYDFEPVFSDIADQDSVDDFGENVFTYDMPYQSSPAAAFDLAWFILGSMKNPRPGVESVSFLANWSDEVAEQAFQLEISDRVSITAPTLGLDGVQYFVNGMRFDVSISGVVVVTWDLARADVTQYWQLEVAGRTELDETTVLGYGLFVPRWILDTSELGVETFLN